MPNFEATQYNRDRRTNLSENELLEIKTISKRVVDEVVDYNLKKTDIKQQAFRFLKDSKFLSGSNEFSRYLGLIIGASFKEFKRRGLDQSGSIKVSKNGYVRDSSNKTTKYPFTNSGFTEDEMEVMMKGARGVITSEMDRGVDEGVMRDIGY